MSNKRDEQTIKPAPKKIGFLVAFAAALIIVVICLFTVQNTVHPPGKTRVVLDRTLEVYVAPPCFNQAEVTNNLVDSTLDSANRLKYKPDSACTEQALQGIKKPLYTVILETAGLRKNHWKW